jgi:hypothetical protein
MTRRLVKTSLAAALTLSLLGASTPAQAWLRWPTTRPLSSGSVSGISTIGDPDDGDPTIVRRFGPIVGYSAKPTGKSSSRPSFRSSTLSILVEFWLQATIPWVTR